MKTVIGLGNALTDVVVSLPADDVLERLGLARGSMTLVDEDELAKVSAAVAGLLRVLSPAGAAGNTIRALARLGGRTAYIGKVGRDETGDFYASALGELGVGTFVVRGVQPSGRCLSLVSPDGERTMVTYLGAALELEAAEISPELFAGSDCLYLEGYLVQNHALIEHAARTARRCGLKVAIDLASFNVVAENRDFLHSLVAEHVDIIFANEDEARAFTLGAEPVKALREMARPVGLVVLKTGAAGALIRRGAEEVRVGVLESARRVDTTGAGDFYAAGFLHGLGLGLSLAQCGTIGAIAAGAVIEVAGTTLTDDRWAEVNALVNKVVSGELLF